ncbi:MAG: putative mitotic spindle assembly checkpoint protein MAD2A [Streblomastix strix]|uniref:Putative mitotic spindle assembly checkpoint protein MAD2A n=1 Tax=Streblomastix strix TaxID=222440 RepID=A0A5J4VUY4_9EUKA|nr:MAG: putative mitotic spindle assembly checkpoint protein MAD2A [Streblomastix strix]
MAEKLPWADFIAEWLMSCTVHKLVFVISSSETNEILEQWAFELETSKDHKINEKQVNRNVKEIHDEIQVIMRQIAASVSSLPLLNEPCSFEIFVYPNESENFPSWWQQSNDRIIVDGQQAKFSQFITNIYPEKSSASYTAKNKI